MAEEKSREAWGRTSSLMALIANVNRDPKRTRPLRPTDFDPFVARKPRAKVPIGVLKDVFINRKLPRQLT